VQGFFIRGTTPIFIAEYLDCEGAPLQHTAETSASALGNVETAKNLRRSGELMRTRFSRNAEAHKLPEAPEGASEAEAQRSAIRTGSRFAPTFTVQARSLASPIALPTVDERKSKRRS
jgi:hypothetical protein